MNRRNLSGILLLYKFDDEDTRQPTCFEDCPRHKQDEWLNSLDQEALKNLTIQLAETIREIGDHFNLVKENI